MCCLGVHVFTRLPIEKPLTLRASEQFFDSLDIGNLPVVVPEIELREVAMQMSLAHIAE